VMVAVKSPAKIYEMDLEIEICDGFSNVSSEGSSNLLAVGICNNSGKEFCQIGWK